MTIAAHLDAIAREFEYDLNLLLDRIARNDARLVVQVATLRKGWRVVDAANDYEVMIVADTFRQVSDWLEAFLRRHPGASLDDESVAEAWLHESMRSVKVPDGLVREPSHVGGTTAGDGSPTRLRVVPEEAA